MDNNIDQVEISSSDDELKHDLPLDEEHEVESDGSNHSFKLDDPQPVSRTRDTRPSLKEADDKGRAAPLLDLTKSGIFNDPELMAKFFPRVKDILGSNGDVSSLTIDEVNELSRYALAKALFTSDSMNGIEGMLDNQLNHPNGTTFGPKLAKPKLSEGDELDLSDITTLDATISGGGVITFPLANSGFRIKLRPLGTDGEIKLEESIIHRIGEVGRSTVGGGVLAMDAIIIDCVLDRILDKIVDHNIKDVEIDDKAKIRSLISHKDIRLLISIMNGIMHLDGYDYDIPCESCNAVSRMNLNVLRTMHYDHGKLTDGQLDQLLLPLKQKISVKQIRRYQEQFSGHEESKVFTVKGRDYRVHLRTGSIDTKMESYGLIFNMLEKLARDVVGINNIQSREAVDAKCQELLQRMWHLHYLPIVKSIEIMDVKKHARKPEVILQLLKSISMADETGELATYLTEFAYDNVVTFATHVPKCSGCGKETNEIRKFDPVVDFFIRRMSHTLSTSIVQEVMMRS